MDTQDQITALAQRLREARGRSQVRGKTAARMLGVTDATISKWIADPGRVQVVKLIGLANAYGLEEVGENLAGGLGRSRAQPLPAKLAEAVLAAREGNLR